MRKIFILLTLSILSICCQPQTIMETKGYLFDKIRANNPLPNEKNEVYYDVTITKENAEKIANRKITTVEFPYLLICGYTHYFSGTEDWVFAVYNTFDVRDMVSFRLDRKVGKYNFYVLTIVLAGRYPSNIQSFNRYITDVDNQKISEFTIGLSDDKESAEKIKKAFLHLVELVGNVPLDKDIF